MLIYKGYGICLIYIVSAIFCFIYFGELISLDPIVMICRSVLKCSKRPMKFS